MLTTRFVLPFLGFCHADWMITKQEGCVYQVNLTIKRFQSHYLECCWSKKYRYDICGRGRCTITAIFPNPGANQVNITLLPDTSLSTLTINVPAFNSLIPEINLEFQISRGPQTEVCILESVKDYHHNRIKSKWFNGKLVAGRSQCSVDLHVASILQCPTRITQVTPGVTTAKTTQTNTGMRLNSSFIMITSSTTDTYITPGKTTTLGLIQSTSPNTKEKKDSNEASKMWIWSIIMALAYFIAGITISVEVVFCCKMYRRSKSFPWCNVRMRRTKTSIVENRLNNGSNKSVTNSLEQRPTLPPPKNLARKIASTTAWTKLDSRKEE